MGLALDRLALDGLVCVVMPLNLPPRAGLRIPATIMATMRARGLEPGPRLALIRTQTRLLLLASIRPLSPTDERLIREFCGQRWFDLAWLPHLAPEEANQYTALAQPWFYEGMAALLGPDNKEFMDNHIFALHPASDDRPYANSFLRWGTLPELLPQMGRGGISLMEQGGLIIAASLAQAVLAASLFILAPVLLARRTRIRGGRKLAQTGYFLALGLGYLVVELMVMKRAALWLGDPLLAVAVVLAVFLPLTGLGSGYAGRILGRGSSKGQAWLGCAVIGIVLSALLVFWGGHYFSGSLLALPLLARIGGVALLTGPLAFFLGIPFPLGLARVAAQSPERTPWLWAVNGCGSVVGPLLAQLVVVEWGIAATAACSIGLYLAAWRLARVMVEPAGQW
ncbi:MAG: hypothetical protein D6E12_16335 [Desulfovibrio sp.]|nr:MAG: hypothetical protein D6E12_16335 [Desulfovibrio sp.]